MNNTECGNLIKNLLHFLPEKWVSNLTKKYSWKNVAVVAKVPAKTLKQKQTGLFEIYHFSIHISKKFKHFCKKSQKHQNLKCIF
jgi:hypothetical protein